MKTSRRSFIKKTFIGAGSLAVGGSALSGSGSTLYDYNLYNDEPQNFNMSGYAAPGIDNVRVGFIGLGMRGPGAVKRMSFIDGVTIAALSDKYQDRVDKAQIILKESGLPSAKSYGGNEDAWKRLCEDPEIDLVYIATPWRLHTPIAVYAMEHGKHVATEVPAAVTIDEAWQLVEASEKTRKHCMMLENCCYDFFELLTLNMARQGYFGEIIHGEGAYLHNLLDLNFDKNGYSDMWRLKENTRNGNLYPTHGLGPVCQVMDINRGDRMDYLTSMQSNDFMMAAKAAELTKTDPFYNEFNGLKYRGNMNTTSIRTIRGRTIMVQHDVTSSRPYSRIHLISGTKGIARKWPSPARIANSHRWLNTEEFKILEKEYTPEIVNKVGEMAKQVGGHGGMDFMMDWRLIDCLRNGLPLDQDVYDAALWSSISPLSEKSVAARSISVDVPDFTRGAWKTNLKVNLTLEGGGTTAIRNSYRANSSGQLDIEK